MTDADNRRLDAFQQRGLRRILGILPSHLDRIATHRSVLEAAEKQRKEKGGITQFETFSQTKKRAVALLGHIIRLPEEDAMTQANLKGAIVKVFGDPQLDTAFQPKSRLKPLAFDNSNLIEQSCQI